MDSNLQLVCPSCMAARKAETQKGLFEKLKTARYVKSGFTDGEVTEHMYVGVGHVVGMLANTPASLQNFHYGAIVKIEFAGIEDVI